MKNIYSLLFPFILLLFACQPSSENIHEKEKKKPTDNIIWTNKDRQFLLDELDRTTKELLKGTENLGLDQWAFQESPDRWSIAEITEHLTLQNELHYREIYALSNAPAMPQYLSVTTGKDGHFTEYANDPKKSQSKWFLQPLGRFESKRQSISAFQRARDGLRGFVETTKIDLRQHFTFRNNGGAKLINEIKIGEVRDLHQLLLTGIAHTDRHLRQIRRIKKHPLYPRDI